MSRAGAGRVAAMVACLGAGCMPEVDPASLPSASTTIVEVGRRLGASRAPEDLERVAGDEPTLLRHLTASERLSLGRAHLRFRIDRPSTVVVAVPDGRVPFWLGDLGFRPDGRTIPHPDGPFRAWSRAYPAGLVGLGVNALDRRARGHYAVFVRGGTPTIEGAASTGFRVVPAGDGVGPYRDSGLAFSPLPAELSGAAMIQSTLGSRHDSALVRGRLWKTRVPSGRKADQVVASLGADPARSIAWNWRTDLSVESTVVEVERADGSEPRTFAGSAESIASAGLLNDPTILRHRAEAASLEPDTAYRYAIRDGSPEGRTPWYPIRTAPVGDRDYSFLAMGDPQCGLEDWGKLLQAARGRHPDAGLLLIAGDLVDRGNERGNWDHFFLRAAGVFEGLPVMSCVGNHEYLDQGPRFFAASFNLPADGPADVPHRLTYSFEYSDAFFAVLDSNPAVYSPAMAAKLADWLDDRLSATGARWKFVMFHHPVYPSHPSRKQPQLAAAWVPVFDKHRVDMVFQGHDHAYLRTYPLRDGRVAATPAEGTTYVVSVSGQKFVPLGDVDYSARGFADVATYQAIAISPTRGTLTYRAFDLEGRELDRLEVVKPRRDRLAGRSAAR